MKDDDLIKQISEQLGLTGIEDILYYHADFLSDEKPVLKGLEKILNSFSDPEVKGLYHIFCNTGQVDEPREEVTKEISDILNNAMTIKNRSFLLEVAGKDHRELRGQGKFQEYWNMLLSTYSLLVTTGPDVQDVRSPTDIFFHLTQIGFNDMRELFKDYLSQGEHYKQKELDDLRQVFDSVDYVEQDLDDRLRYGHKKAKLVSLWREDQPWLIDYVPQIIKIMKEAESPLELAEELMDFRQLGGLTATEMDSYLSLLEQMPNLCRVEKDDSGTENKASMYVQDDFEAAQKALRKAKLSIAGDNCFFANFKNFTDQALPWEKYHFFELAYLESSAAKINQVIESGELSAEKYFSFFRALNKPGKEKSKGTKQDKFGYDTENIVHTFGVDLYKASAADINLAYKIKNDIFSAGTDLAGIFLETLLGFRDQPYAHDLIDNFTGRCVDSEDEAGGISLQPGYVQSIVGAFKYMNHEVGQLLSMKVVGSHLEYLINHDPKSEKIFTPFVQSVGYFHNLLSESCTSDEIQAEYKGWIEAAKGVKKDAKLAAAQEYFDQLEKNLPTSVEKSLGELMPGAGGMFEPDDGYLKLKELGKIRSSLSKIEDHINKTKGNDVFVNDYTPLIKQRVHKAVTKHFSSESPFLREVFLKYNAPATYHEQRDVARLFANMISRQELPLNHSRMENLASELPFTGGRAVELPNEISLFKTKRDNAKMYTLLAALGGGMHAYGGYDLTQEEMKDLAVRRVTESSPPGESPDSLSGFFELFPNYQLAESIFIAAEQSRVFHHLTSEFPGLRKDVESYFNIRKHVSKGNEAQNAVNDAYSAVMLNEKISGKSKSARTTKKLTDLLKANQRQPTVAGSLKFLNEAYDLLETAMPVKPQDKEGIDQKVIDEILRQRLKGVNTESIFAVSKQGAHRYHEYNPEHEILTTVYEQQVPTKRNPIIATLLKKVPDEVEQMRIQLQELIPPDVYLERKKLHGRLDRRARQKYQRDLAQGKIPNPRIFSKKIIEKRDVASILAFNMNSSLGKPIDGVLPRMVIQQVAAAFAHASHQLGDNVGIYGFSGQGKDNVSIYAFKEMNNPFNEDVDFRLGFIPTGSYNRNGAVYRHLASRLADVKAEQKLFIELTPTFEPKDVAYSGARALEDSRLAINGMEMRGISPLCLCLSDDQQSRNNLNVVYPAKFVQTSPRGVFADLTNAYLRLSK